MAGLLRVATAGSVDDGKSTLIGRLLHDSKAVFADQLDAVLAASRRRGYDATDLALLVDGLRAEREQGITIDVAYRYFATPAASFILADTPGHVQYTRNMVTGASTARAAVVLVDARSGPLDQTRRHAAIAGLLGVSDVVVAVNKMDLVSYSEETFDAIGRDFAELAARVGIERWAAIPVSALCGDNVVARSEAMPWYAGPTLLGKLEDLCERAGTDPAAAWSGRGVGARVPVQLVIRPRTAEHPDYRGYAGRVAGAPLRVGDPVTVLPSGQRGVVSGIDTFDDSLDVAEPGRSVVVRLADPVDVARGDTLVTGAPPMVTSTLAVTVCWLADRSVRAGERYRVRHGGADVPGVVTAVRDRLDVTTLDRVDADALELNDIGRIELRTGSPLVADPYSSCHTTGALLLVDERTGATVGAGMIQAGDGP